MYFAYIIKSLKTGRYYIGSTSDIEKRILYHNNSWSRSTKNRGPWKLVYFEKYNTKNEGMKREYEMKSWKSRKLLEDLINRGPVV